MKAIRIHEFGGPEVLKLEQVQDPAPGPGQVLVRVKAAGVNPVDTYIRAGNYGPRPFPFTPGMDAAGIVETVGSGVSGWKSGDRVYLYGGTLGAYAELVSAEPHQLFPLPPQTTFEEGASIGVPYGTAYYALFHRAHAIPGEWLLIHGGTGGVGTAAIQMGRARGLRVVATGGTEEGRRLALKQGALHALDHGTADYIEKAVKLTGGEGFDIILELLANVNLAKDLKALARRGRVIVVGSRGPIEIDPRDTMRPHTDIRGMALLTLRPEELAPVHAALIAGLETGVLKPVIADVFPLAQAARAHEKVMAAGHRGKIILVP